MLVAHWIILAPSHERRELAGVDQEVGDHGNRRQYEQPISHEAGLARLPPMLSVCAEFP